MQLARLQGSRAGNYLFSEVNFDQRQTWDRLSIPASSGLFQDAGFFALARPEMPVCAQAAMQRLAVRSWPAGHASLHTRNSPASCLISLTLAFAALGLRLPNKTLAISQSIKYQVSEPVP